MKNLTIADRSLEWLLASATDAMLIVDKQGQIVLANPALERLFGYEHGALAGKTLETLIPERFRQEHTGLRSHYIGHPRPRAMGAGMELFAVRKDGSEFMVEVSLSPLQSSDMQPVVMATIYDISARKQAERALQDSERRMRAVFETAVDAIITIDERGIMERVNPAAERMFGYSEAEVCGKNVSMLMPSPHREQHDGYLAHYAQTGEKRVIGKGREVEGLRRDGSVFPMDLAVAEMEIGGRRMFTGLVRDITERKQAEAQGREMQARLRELAAHQEKIKEHERTRIAQEIHDELGGLLTGMKAYVNVLIERAGAQSDPLLGEVQGLTQEAIDTVRRVITDLRPSVLDQLGVWAALEWYAEQVQQRTGLRCVCDIAPELSDLAVDAERSTMLFRIAQEALTNVVRHAQATEVRVSAARDGGAVLLTVKDNGKGIDKTRLLDKESWGILGMHERTRGFGGELTITGTPGQGTLLQLRLPLEAHHD
ncbi:PAS domain S-box protein [Pseudoduganella sp. RAF19]|uniref:PAS domain-containing sensor histidine kinase n=3 Tax=unclassified Pseudoduganella TaxID=2637179 RepID=UPI003F955288